MFLYYYHRSMYLPLNSWWSVNKTPFSLKGWGAHQPYIGWPLYIMLFSVQCRNWSLYNVLCHRGSVQATEVRQVVCSVVKCFQLDGTLYQIDTDTEVTSHSAGSGSVKYEAALNIHVRPPHYLQTPLRVPANNYGRWVYIGQVTWI